ncbi:glycosyl hydrolase family 28-related protein [Opitutus terrae]|uniref:SMP-30/Gluconolaconase/LRE domain protein n=1 Tax=Opitutus terrae (strain DSM 11246 / JCM 15787 / PB90-1) TaxID=452637 RepID=B1ZPN7_OPITP|nr:glycosyl hydrolase family 28-related protein [Opitutus terrae]ACB74556.1 SMP-30/Gluconolaconase/LRE domain protein [Opitutus terrae PB90-1]
MPFKILPWLRRFAQCGLFLVSVFTLAPVATASVSIYPLRPDDPQAVYATREAFGVHADGLGDDSAALQRAIDQVQETTRRGIVFLPEGRYRLTRALQVWSGIRLIGYGANRPVLVLGANTPGYQDGAGKYLVHFVSDRPATPDLPVRDANPGTFYSGISNVDIEIGPGNPAAVGVRAHFAQHCHLAHMEFRIGEGRAGVEEVGNEAEDLQFHGGEFGITLHKPSPSWPFVLLDSSFVGQRQAAIETEEGGLTLIRVRMADVATAVVVRPERAEELFMKDCRLERISGPALVISDERSARTQINLQNVVCADVPRLARFRESGREIAGRAEHYRVQEFSHGLQVTDLGAMPRIHTTSVLEPLEALPALVESDISPLPPMASWVDVRTLGAKGDGVSDDTAALRAAIAQHRTIYLPSGRYRVTEPILLRPDTVLVGLSPITTQIVIDDFTAAFQGVNGPTERPKVPDIPGVPRAWLQLPPFAGKGAPVPLLEAPRGGTNIVTGIGLDTGGVNNRAVALKWCAGERSLVNDVRFLGGHGTYGPDGQWLAIYNDNRTADPDPQRRWDSQHWSLWVTDGGGGTFKGLWTPSPFAAAGLYVSHTSTPGRVYAMSSEHHVRNEVKLRDVANWEFYALQTEEERGESPHALPLEIDGCRNLLVANFFIYRVDLPVPFETGIRVTNSHALRFRGLHVYSPGKLSFDNTLVDQTHGVQIRAREIARLDVSGRPPAKRAALRVEKLAGGFTSIDGLAADAAGSVTFVDQAASRIWRWAPAEGLSLVTDAIPQPVALAFDAAGNLLVVARHGNVYALPPNARESAIAVLTPAPAAVRNDAVFWLPANRWRDGHDWIAANTAAPTLHYVSPDGSALIPAPSSYARLTEPRGGWGAGTIDVARAYALLPARAGEPVYVADEFGQKTWRFRMQPNGALAEPELFAEEGECGTAVDPAGNVYVCAGNVLVYNPHGELIDLIEVPERPAVIAFGGAERRTLFIAARTSLYAFRLR